MVSGEFFEAGTSQGYPATLEKHGVSLLLVTNGSSRSFDPDALRVSVRLARLPRRIHFPGGSMFTTSGNDQVDSLLRSLGRSPKGSWISFFESGWRWTLLALLVLPVVLFLLFSVGMPLVAKPLAAMVPDTVKSDLDRNVIEFLDNRVLEPSGLSLERQTELTEKLARFSIFSPNARLLFRGGGLLGANALALPGGTIIFTDEIVELAEYDGELVAVYLHEIGHVTGNHAMRNIIQMTGVSFVLGWMLGDLTVITDIALVGAPVFLQKMVYSRRSEIEADTYAMALMPITGYSKKCFADIMEKLSAQHSGKMDDFPDYLSSHPPTRERIAMANSDQACSEVRSRPGAKQPTPGEFVGSTNSGPFSPVEISPPEIASGSGIKHSEDIQAGDSDYSAIHKVAPAYPRQALIEGIQGYCVIQYTVTSLGTVENPMVVKEQCTHELFMTPSLEASLKFKYKPRIIDSKAVDVPGVENRFTYEIMPFEPDQL